MKTHGFNQTLRTVLAFAAFVTMLAAAATTSGQIIISAKAPVLDNLYAGGDRLYARASATHDLCEYSGSPFAWIKLGGPGAGGAVNNKNGRPGRGLAVNNKTVYALSPQVQLAIKPAHMSSQYVVDCTVNYHSDSDFTVRGPNNFEQKMKPQLLGGDEHLTFVFIATGTDWSYFSIKTYGFDFYSCEATTLK